MEIGLQENAQLCALKEKGKPVTFFVGWKKWVASVVCVCVFKNQTAHLTENERRKNVSIYGKYYHKNEIISYYESYYHIEKF